MPAAVTCSSALKRARALCGRICTQKKKNREHKKANAMPVHIHFLARCGFCAPIFWADMDAIALENAPAGSIAKLSNFAQIPTAAEATTPRELTIALITRNDRLTMVS